MGFLSLPPTPVAQTLPTPYSRFTNTVLPLVRTKAHAAVRVRVVHLLQQEEKGSHQGRALQPHPHHLLQEYSSLHSKTSKRWVASIVLTLVLGVSHVTLPVA